MAGPEGGSAEAAIGPAFQVAHRDPDRVERRLTDGASEGPPRHPDEHGIHQAHSVPRLSRCAKRDSKTQGDRPDERAAAESVVAIGTDEEDPHAESHALHEVSGAGLWSSCEVLGHANPFRHGRVRVE